MPFQSMLCNGATCCTKCAFPARETNRSKRCLGGHRCCSYGCSTIKLLLFFFLPSLFYLSIFFSFFLLFLVFLFGNSTAGQAKSISMALPQKHCAWQTQTSLCVRPNILLSTYLLSYLAQMEMDFSIVVVALLLLLLLLMSFIWLLFVANNNKCPLFVHSLAKQIISLDVKQMN